VDVHGIPFPPPALQTYRVYPFPSPAVWTRRVYPSTAPAVWTSRTFPFSPLPTVEMGCRVYSFPQPAVWTCRVNPTCSIRSVDVQDVSIFAASSGRAGCIPLHRHQYRRAGQCVSFFTFVQFFQMPECWTVRHPVSSVPE
jgi:hypothetical protein